MYQKTIFCYRSNCQGCKKMSRPMTRTWPEVKLTANDVKYYWGD